MTSQAIVSHLRRTIAARRPGDVVAVMCIDGAWVNGAVMDFADYAAAYGARARKEIAVDGLTLADLDAALA
jgi:hypothetical protein